jgi:anthranilate synthase component 1
VLFGAGPEAVVLRPSQEAFEELARRGNLVPVVREDGNTSFLFESVEGGEKWGRYSFMGSGARAIFRARGRDVEWTANGETRRVCVEGDPLEYLRAELARLEPVHLEGVELPRFLGGAVGMVSYDWVRFVERIPDANPDEIEMPDLWFVLGPTWLRSTARRRKRWSRRCAACATRSRRRKRRSPYAPRWTSSAAVHGRRSTRS